VVILPKIGVLAIQGSVIEHLKALEKLDGVTGCEVKTIEDIHLVDGLIIPGGESTTMGKLLREFGLMEPLKKIIIEGMPVWGTCAGLILLADKIVDEDVVHLGVLDITVKRNAYGSQLDSFIINKKIEAVSDKEQQLVFIRAPWIEYAGLDVEVLARHDGKIIAVRKDNILGTSFHPELTQDTQFHKYFANMCKHR
jgi:5'-phosphate synthase pdxT subunit